MSSVLLSSKRVYLTYDRFLTNITISQTSRQVSATLYAEKKFHEDDPCHIQFETGDGILGVVRSHISAHQVCSKPQQAYLGHNWYSSIGVTKAKRLSHQPHLSLCVPVYLSLQMLITVQPAKSASVKECVICRNQRQEECSRNERKKNLLPKRVKK